MSGRFYKKVLKELEESKHHGNRDDTEEDEHLGDSGGPSLSDRYAKLIEDNEGPDESVEVTDIYDELNVQPASKNNSKKKKKKKSKESDFTWAETLGDSFQETTALGDSSKRASSVSLLEIDSEYLNLEKQLTRVYGSELARSFKNNSYGRYGQQRRGSDGVYHPKNTVLTSAQRNWPRWDHSFSMVFIENKDGLTQLLQIYTFTSI